MMYPLGGPLWDAFVIFWCRRFGVPPPEEAREEWLNEWLAFQAGYEYGTKG